MPIADAIGYASQIGRLDFLSAVLAVLALILGLGAFPIFFFVQRRAEEIARIAVEAKLIGAEENLEKMAIAKLESMLPSLIDDYMELVKNSATDEMGDEIAAVLAREDGNVNDDKRG